MPGSCYWTFIVPPLVELGIGLFLAGVELWFLGAILAIGVNRHIKIAGRILVDAMVGGLGSVCQRLG